MNLGVALRTQWRVVLQLSPAGRVAHVNPEAATLLEAGGMLQTDLAGRLRFASRRGQAKLAVALAGLRAGKLPVAEFAVEGARVRLAGIAADVLGEGPAGLLLGAGCRPCLVVVVVALPPPADAGAPG